MIYEVWCGNVLMAQFAYKYDAQVFTDSDPRFNMVEIGEKR